jgi:hypothetical protein
MYDSVQQDMDERAAQIERVIMTEVLLSQEAVEGYERIFFLPYTLNGQEYELFPVDSHEAVIRYSGGERLVMVPNNVTFLNITRGYNLVSKGGGLVFIQDASNVDCLDVDGDSYNGSGMTCNPAAPLYDCMETDILGVDSTTVNKGAFENSNGLCTDNADNDCDFYVDCNDPDCSGFETCKTLASFAYIPETGDCGGVSGCIDTAVFHKNISLSSGKSIGSLITPPLGNGTDFRWHSVVIYSNFTRPVHLPLGDGLVMQYLSDPARPYEDATGNLGTLTPHGGSQAPGVLENGYDFNSLNNYLEGFGSFPYTTDFTLEFWMNWRGNTGSTSGHLGGIFSSSSYRLFVTDPPPVAWSQLVFQGFKTAGGYFERSSDLPIPLNNWTHITVVVHGNPPEVIFYRNGVATNTVSPVDTADTLQPSNSFLWGEGQANDYQLLGTLDELQMYNVQLSDDEIKEHYLMQSNLLRVQLCSSDSLTGCVFPSDFRGPDGTMSTYYTGPSNMTLSVSGLSDGKYLRARFLLSNMHGDGSPIVYLINATGIVIQ